MTAHSENRDELLKSLSTEPQRGLTRVQAEALLAKHGPNRLRAKKKKVERSAVFDQFRDVMILILIAAALVSFVVACYEGEAKEFFEPVLILVIVIINAVMGVLQESKGGKSA